MGRPGGNSRTTSPRAGPLPPHLRRAAQRPGWDERGYQNEPKQRDGNAMRPLRSDMG